MYDFSKTKIHCSALSQIMASGRKKTNIQLYREAVADLEKKNQMYEKLKKKDGRMGDKYLDQIGELMILIPRLEVLKNVEEPLSEGCKTFLSSVYAREKYGKWSVAKDIGSRATEKGKEVEEDAITLVSRLDRILFEKNEIRVEDEWFSGWPDFFEGKDIYNATKIHDVKCPWDIESFLGNLTRTLPLAYYWQMQGYMSLTGAESAEVHFCLLNTPERFIKQAADAMLRNMLVISAESPEYKKAESDIINNMTFDNVPLQEKRIKFKVQRNDEDIENARKRVEKCREYLGELEKLHLNYDFTVTSRTFDVNSTYEPERSTSE